MDLESLLQSGSTISSGKGLHQKKKSQSKMSKEIAEDVVKHAIDEGLSDAAEHFTISETAVSKYLARAIKKDETLTASTFIESSRCNEIESYIRASNTTSIKRLCEGAMDKYSEAEIRIVKADIEKRGVSGWDY